MLDELEIGSTVRVYPPGVDPDAELRASRRCSDCVHFGAYVEVGGSWNATCLAWHWNGDAEENREPAEILRTAATCDDFEAVDDEREGD